MLEHLVAELNLAILDLQNTLGKPLHQMEQLKALKNKKSEAENAILILADIEKEIKARRAIDFLAGPSGLIQSKTESIFEKLNQWINHHLSRLIPEGVDTNSNIKAEFIRTDKRIELVLSKGSAIKSKKLLSSSEKARVTIFGLESLKSSASMTFG